MLLPQDLDAAAAQSGAGRRCADARRRAVPRDARRRLSKALEAAGRGTVVSRRQVAVGIQVDGLADEVHAILSSVSLGLELGGGVLQRTQAMDIGVHVVPLTFGQGSGWTAVNGVQP